MATAQSPATPSSDRLTRSAAAEDTAFEADNCLRQQRSQPDGQAAQELQRRVKSQHHDPRERLALDNPEHTTAPPGTQVGHSLFGEPLSRTRLDSLFIREQHESEHQFKDKWNFDVAEERPVIGRWRYEAAQ